MARDHARLICVALLAVGVGAALVACLARARLEAGNRTVALILDHDQVRRLASVGGFTTLSVLERMRQAGATHLAVTEQTLSGVLRSGEVCSAPVRPEDATGVVPPTASFVGPPDIMQRLQRALAERTGLGRRTAVTVPESTRSWRVNVGAVDPADVADLGLGYSRAAVQEANLAQLSLVVRPHAEANQWRRATFASLALIQELNPNLVVYAGTSVPGFLDDLPAVAAEFRQRGLLFGCVEFGKQSGDAALAAGLPGNLVRVHSINEAEMLGMTVQRAVDRFALGVRERNIRACYVRLFDPSGADPIASAESYVRTLASRLRAYGFTLGTPRPYADLGLSPWLRWLAMLGPLAALALCLLELLGCRPVAVVAALSLGALVLLAGTLLALTLAAKLCALLGALVLPTLALGRRPAGGRALSRSAALGRGLLLFGASSGLSVVGGLLVVGCLADTRFLVKLDQFAGVKLAHLLPLLAVLALQVGWDLGSLGSTADEPSLATLLRGWRVAAESVVRYWHAVLLVACLAAVALLILRSGNESGVGVSGLELQFRSVLDRVFGVRPRTKEVLIGHPLLLLGLARAAAGRRAGRWVFLSFGAIGQVSLINTFSHLHTPIVVSVTRTVHGLWSGALLGVVLYLLVDLAERRWRVRPPSP